MLTLISIICLVNLCLTLALLRQSYPELLRRNLFASTPAPQPKSQFKPIRHKRVVPSDTFSMRVGGHSSIANGVLSYWQSRDSSDEPFVALYFKDSGIFDGGHVPPNSYIVLENEDTRPIPAPNFEDRFIQAKVVATMVRPLVHPLKSKTTAPEPEGSHLSEDDAKKLAEEYELVDKSPPPSVP